MGRDEWKDLVQFSRSEQRGINVLIFLCLFSAAYSYVVPEWISRREISRFEALMPIDVLHASPQIVTSAADSDTKNHSPTTPTPSIQSSRPRTPAQQRDHAVRPTSSARKAYTPPEKPAPKEIRINSMDAKTLIRTRRMPAEIAFRLVRFRTELGGFHSVGQLLDIYGMTDSLYQSMADAVVLEQVDLPRIPINSASLEELQQHPYIHKGLANQMINFREKVKPFESTDDLLRLYFMDEVLLEKLMPYLSFY